MWATAISASPVGALASPATADLDRRSADDPSVVRPDPAGDAHQLIMEHLGLADAIARRFTCRGEEEDDLRQVARTGLVEAAHRFDASRGEFPPFAAATITGAVKRQFRDHGWLVRPPRRTQELVIVMRPVWSDLAQSLGCEPTSRQVADQLGVPEQEVLSARLAGQGYRAARSEDLDYAGCAFGVEDDWSQLEARLVVNRLLAELDVADRSLLRMRFVDQRTQSDIAEDLQISQMQVSRLLNRVFDRLRVLLTEPTAA